MALSDRLNPDFPRFDVICKDSIMQEHKITEGVKYQVLGELFGFYIIVNDKGQLDKLSKARFEVVE